MTALLEYINVFKMTHFEKHKYLLVLPDIIMIILQLFQHNYCSHNVYIIILMVPSEYIILYEHEISGLNCSPHV